MSDPLPIGEVVAGWAERQLVDAADRAAWAPERAGVTRTPLSLLIRHGVLLRDGRTCQLCKSDTRRPDRTPEVDHIVPWSAGGADHPVNLRCLCLPCNQARSNRVTGLERRAGLIVRQCRACDPAADIGEAVTVEAFCLNCVTLSHAPYLVDLLIGGPIPGRGCPDWSGHDGPEPVAVERPWAVRNGAVLRERVRAQRVACPWCHAGPGFACASAGRPLTRTSAHAARLAAADA